MGTTTIGEQVRRRRMALGLSLRQLSARSGVPPSTIHGIERGHQTSPAIDTVSALAEALGVSVATLLRPRKKRAA